MEGRSRRIEQDPLTVELHVVVGDDGEVPAARDEPLLKAFGGQRLPGSERQITSSPQINASLGIDLEALTAETDVTVRSDREGGGADLDLCSLGAKDQANTDLTVRSV